MKSYPLQYERQHKSFTNIEHHIGVAGRLHSSLLRIYFPGFMVRILYQFTLQRRLAETYPICDDRSSRSARRSFAPLQVIQRPHSSVVKHGSTIELSKQV